MTPTYFTNIDNKKHPAFILAVDADFFTSQKVLRHGDTDMTPAFANPINHYPHRLFLGLVQSDLVIREREYLDNGITTHESRRTACGTKFKTGNPRYKQILPYLVVSQEQEDGATVFYPYRRTKQVGESRLAGNGSVGYGGHVDLVDVVMGENPVRATSLDDVNDSEVPVSYNSVIDLRATIMGSLLRECDEEFTVYDKEGNVVPVDPKWLSFGDLFILDNSNDVGELHVGIIMRLQLPAGYNLVATEDELAKLPPMTAEQMLTDPDFKAENWTRIYLEHFVASTSVLGIDHGGEQVGQVEAAFLGNELAALEQGHAERNVLNVKLDENDPDPQGTVDKVMTDTHADGRRESKLFHATVDGIDMPLLLSDEEERKLTDLAAQGNLKPEELRAMAADLPETETKILNNLADIIEAGHKIGAIRSGYQPLDNDPIAQVAQVTSTEIPTSEKQAINFGRGGLYAPEGTPELLADLQNRCAKTYHANLEKGRE